MYYFTGQKAAVSELTRFCRLPLSKAIHRVSIMRRHPSQFAEHFFASDEFHKRKQEKSRQSYRFRVSFGLVSLCLFMLVYVIFLLYLHWSTMATDETAPSLTIRNEQKLEQVNKEYRSQHADLPIASVITSPPTENPLIEADGKPAVKDVNKDSTTDADALLLLQEEEAQGSDQETPVIDSPTVAISVAPTELKSSTTLKLKEAPILSRHTILKRYADLHAFLLKHDQEMSQKKTNKILVLLFTCDEDIEDSSQWMTLCNRATDMINQTFKKADERYHLVTTHVGSESKWKKSTNPYKSDFDLKLKRIPTLMRWDGNGRTSMTLWQHSLLEQASLDYIFEIADNTSEASIARTWEGKKKYKVTNNYTDYRAMLEQYRTRPNNEDEHLFYVSFVSGHLKENNRPWCPYCRFAEVPIHIAYHAHAPLNARLIRAEVTDEYRDWKQRKSPFQNQPELKLTVVPALYNVTRSPTNDGFQLKFDRILVRLDLIAELRPLFQSGGFEHP
uniref:Uncharacterized protein AlNc14C166G7893 n=1 Tax=Albugo laibachii Nc14 TaxID=890382 RepID=F0WN60_9STRA|nr:conserved hypothetical protein [Albugo laibachii Nc14]|eukprot:CCA22749.1 conserved hypothetical protein [Albugo laibachii Nc14]